MLHTYPPPPLPCAGTALSTPITQTRVNDRIPPVPSDNPIHSPQKNIWPYSSKSCVSRQCTSTPTSCNWDCPR